MFQVHEGRKGSQRPWTLIWAGPEGTTPPMPLDGLWWASKAHVEDQVQRLNRLLLVSDWQG